MFNSLITKVIGSKNQRDLRRMQPIVQQVAALEPEVQKLTDAQLQGRTGEYKERLERGATLDELLPEAFATVRDASVRTLGMRHFDVQIIGGIVLHRGRIAEMKTGEGKTLVATLPVYLNALEGRGVHVVTVNDYLAGRDAEWMGQIYRFMGLSVGCIQHDMHDQENGQQRRREAYAADVTYGTNNEFGFDYLRDNMKFTMDGMVQRGHRYGIVDEVDSILIDEARTPLIISGPSEGSIDKYYAVDRIIPRLRKGAVIAGDAPREDRESLEASGDYIVDEKARAVTLTEPGVAHAERLLGVANLYDPSNIDILHAVNQALRAHTLYRRDVDYLVEGGEVVIIDEFTGRKMPGRRWSDGLHQAVEAREGVKIERENQTLATITFQNYFRMYDKLSGMTGTADTEAPEFAQIYDLDVSVIPTNRTLVRIEHPDVIYQAEKDKFRAVVEEIREYNERGQPVLVGTISIENSEKLSVLLRKGGIHHEVLNAKHHAREAEIVAQAGRLGAVTIATNMAGRGTDILLGGNPEARARAMVREEVEGGWEEADEATRRRFIEAARAEWEVEHQKVVDCRGLHILGTERHEARRIDNQLRGRAGRQGDPGTSRFYLSLEDDLMRRFGGNRLQKAMNMLKLEDDIPIEAPLVTRAIERAQKRVEEQNFGIRKHLLEYDDVMNKQRIEVYRLRHELLEGQEQRDYLMAKAGEILDWLIEEHLPADKDPGDWDTDKFAASVLHYYGIDATREGLAVDELGTEEIRDALRELIEARYRAKEEHVGAEIMRHHERFVILQIIDSQWKDHLLSMDHLKEGIGLRAYGQRDPLMEYKRESFELFTEMKNRIEDEVVRYLMLLEPMTVEERAAEEEKRRREQEMIFAAASQAKAGEKRRPVRSRGGKVGRNAPCPCGSGKKYKKCHGAAAS